MQGPVGVAVAAAVQPVPAGLARAGRDRGDPAQVGEGGLTAQPFGVLAGSCQQLASVVGADRQQPQQPGRGPTDQGGQPLVGQGDLLVQQLDALGDHHQGGLGPVDWVGQRGLVRAQPGTGATNVGVERPSSASRRLAGAVTSSPLSWLMAAVRALTAPLRAVRSARIDSTIPSRRLGAAVATPASTARAAASASIGSDLPRWRRVRRSGRSTSTTHTPWSRSTRVRPAP